MSEYATTVTEFNDGELLAEALTGLGYTPVVSIGNPQPLVGYMGDYRTMDGQGHTTDPSKAMKADIIIPRKQVGGSSNDLGFRRMANGTYEAIISDYDSHKHNQTWVNKLSVSYQERSVERTAKKMGVRQLTKKKLPNGDIEYTYLKA